jgi:hypothetical protein
MDINVQELIFMAHKRLCNQADANTRKVMRMICDEVIKTNPELKDFLVPECEYLNDHCNEMFPCGRIKE